MKEGKRKKKNQNKRKIKKLIINIFLIFLMMLIAGYFIIINYQDRSIREGTDFNVAIENNDITNSVVEFEEKQYPKEDIVKEYKGYFVEAKLEIPVISLQTYILEEYSSEALNISVNKFWGAEANEIGNYCVVGHNAANKNMFGKLQKLKVGDRFFISDRRIGKVEYEIYDMYKVLPTNITCLNQQTRGNREVTLITCTNDSKKRIIVKAREVII